MGARPADVFWCAVPAVAVAHNVWAAVHGREQLSEAMDRYRVATPAAEVAVWAVAGHLSRRLPLWADPLHGLYLATKGFARYKWVRRIVLAGLLSQVLGYLTLVLLSCEDD